MARQLENMIVVITGASAGIGRELARQLSEKKARLVLSARRMDRLNELNQSLGGGHLVVQADVANQADCERLIATAYARFGRIDTLVCNAGYGISKTVADTSAEEMSAIFQTNVFGTVDCIRAAIPKLKLQAPRNGWRGQIMIVSSAAGRRGIPYFGAYSATKFAQLGLAEALRVELKSVKIAVTSVHPIGTSTDFFTTAEQNGGVKIPPEGQSNVQQTPETVARKMIAGIRKPVPEVWPLNIVRYGMGFATMLPGITDAVLGKYHTNIENDGAKTS